MIRLIFPVLLFLVSALYGFQDESNRTVVHESYYYKGKLVTLTRTVPGIDSTLDANRTDHLTDHPKRLTYYDDHNRSVTVTDRLIVRFREKNPDISRISQEYNLTLIKKLRRVCIFAVPEITDVFQRAKAIYENEDVRYAQPSFVRSIKKSTLLTPGSVESRHLKMNAKIISSEKEDIKSMKDGDGSVNYYKYYDAVFRYADESFWQIHNKGGFEATAYSEGIFTPITAVADVDPNVLETIDAGYTGKNVRVAVIDSAFELNHPDLRFSDTYNIFKRDKDISPDTTGDFHGTAVAGVIAANRNNNYGIMGVAPDAYLIGLNGLFQIEDTDYFSESYIEMFYTAMEKGADIINCSWESLENLDEATEDALREVAEEGRDGKGAFIVFSTGNEGTLKLGHEAALPFVISVGSVESNGKRAGYSTYGKKLDLVAPSNFVSLDLLGQNGFEEKDMGFVTGTSFSAPVVSGCIALILEANPDLTRGQVLDIIYSTTKKVGEGNFTDGSFHYDYSYRLDEEDPYNVKYPKNSKTGYGLIDVKAAVEKARKYGRVQKTPALLRLDAEKIEGLKPGWSIIASPLPVSDMSLFDKAQIVWTNVNGKWMGYSSNGVYADELAQKGVLLTQIEANAPVWIYR